MYYSDVICVIVIPSARASLLQARSQPSGGGGGGFVGGPKGDRVGWGGVCVCVGGGEGITIVSGPGGGGSFEPPEPPPLATGLLLRNVNLIRLVLLLLKLTMNLCTPFHFLPDEPCFVFTL